MKSIFTVRNAGEGDSASIEFLVAAALAESSRYRGIGHSGAQASQQLVAVAGDSVVGVLRYRVDGPTALIMLVHVHEEARGVGIGDALVHEAIKQLSAANVSWVRASAQPGDRELKNLFERHGLVAQEIVVGKSLSDPSTAEHASQ